MTTAPGKGYHRVDQTSSDAKTRSWVFLGGAEHRRAPYRATAHTRPAGAPIIHACVGAASPYRTLIVDGTPDDLTALLMRTAEQSFAEVWDSPEDDVWDSV